MEPIEQKTIVVFGVTGSGKSTILNRLAGISSLFEEGEQLNSMTKLSSRQLGSWLGKDEIPVAFIDTPGFCDNQDDPVDIIQNLIKFIDSLRNGFNIGLFLIPVTNERMHKEHIDSLKLLTSILDEDSLSHIWIVFTQVDKLDVQFRDKSVNKFLAQVPPILEQSGINIGSNHFITMDYNNFETCSEAIFKVLTETAKYIPKIVEDIDPNNPETFIELMISSPRVQEYLQKKREFIQENLSKMRKLAELNDKYRTQIEDQEEKMRVFDSALENKETLVQEAILKLQQENSRFAAERKQAIGELYTILKKFGKKAFSIGVPLVLVCLAAVRLSRKDNPQQIPKLH